MERVFTPHGKRILMVLATVQLMVTLDFSIVNVALSSIQRSFHLLPAELQWVVSAYALLFGGLLLLGGRIVDVFERKRVLLFGLTLFSLASLAGGLAPSLLIVLTARVAQGIGAAIVSPAALALLTTTFPEGPERERALGIVGSVSGVGFGAGVILGGVLTRFLHWNWVFFVNVPLGLLTLVGTLLLLPTSRVETVHHRLDLEGLSWEQEPLPRWFWHSLRWSSLEQELFKSCSQLCWRWSWRPSSSWLNDGACIRWYRLACSASAMYL